MSEEKKRIEEIHVFDLTVKPVTIKTGQVAFDEQIVNTFLRIKFRGLPSKNYSKGKSKYFDMPLDATNEQINDEFFRRYPDYRHHIINIERKAK